MTNKQLRNSNDVKFRCRKYDRPNRFSRILLQTFLIMQENTLQSFYDEMYTTARDKICCGEEEIDPIIDDSTSDRRLGLTLVLRPPKFIQESLNRFLDELQSHAPQQYYYPQNDLHMTVLSIIPSHDGFNINHLNISDYVKVIEEALQSEPLLPITIRYTGITASTSCVMVQGFPEEDALNVLRDRLRLAFKKVPHLRQSIDQRYTLTTAHSTIARLRKPLGDSRNDYLNALDRHRSTEFGSFTVEAIDLVTNDWYLRSEKTVLLHRFIL